MEYQGPDEVTDDVSSAFEGADSWSDADDYLLNDIGVALRLASERL